MHQHLQMILHMIFLCHAHPMHMCLSQPMAMMADALGMTALMAFAEMGHVKAMRVVLAQTTEPSAVMMLTNSFGATALMAAAAEGHVECMGLLLNHPSADAAAMMMLTTSSGVTALMAAAAHGRLRVVLQLSDGATALTFAAINGHVACTRLLLYHPSADAAAMMMLTTSSGVTALMAAAAHGHVECMGLLLNHPSADAAAMMKLKDFDGASAFTSAAQFASQCGAGSSACTLCAPLLLLLRRVAKEPQPSDDAEWAHMTKVMEALCRTSPNKLFGDDKPDDARDECVRLLLERGASSIVPEMARPVLSRIVRELAQMARVPHLINEAVVGMAALKRPRESAL